jgi:hypothetical protein
LRKPAPNPEKDVLPSGDMQPAIIYDRRFDVYALCDDASHLRGAAEG